MGAVAQTRPPASGEEDFLNLVVEIKGYRGEDAKEKASTMATYWVPGVNHLGKFGRWAFAEFTDKYAIESEFDEVIQKAIAESKAGAGATGESKGEPA